MNRVVVNRLRDVLAAVAESSQADPRFRCLFVNVLHLGWRTGARQLQEHTAPRNDLLGYHVDLERPFWFKLLGKYFVRNGLDFHPWRYLQLSRLWLGGFLSRMAGLDRLDAVHVMPHSFALPLFRLKRENPRISVATRLDQTGVLEVRDFGRNRFATQLAIRGEARILHACDLITTLSGWAAESVVRDYGVPQARVVVAPPAMPLRAVTDSGPSRKDKACRIVFIGNDWKRKGGPELLRLHQAKWSTQTELHVVSKKAPRDSRARNVIWHGTLAHAQIMNELLPAMDLAVLMTYEDTFGFVLLEAAAAGVPAVSVKLAGIPEIVEDGVSGILVPPGDWDRFAKAVEFMINHPDKRRAMGQAARQLVRERFDPARNYNRWLDALKAARRSCTDERSGGM